VAKIGIVNMAAVMKNSKAGKKMATDLNAMGKRMQADLEKRKKEIEELRRTLENQAMVLSKEVLDRKKRDIQVKMYDFKIEQNKYKNELQTANQKKVEQLHKEVRGIMNDIGKKEGYLLIIDSVMVLYAPGSNDLTDLVIRKYDAKFSG
jgi:outer membrane protein